MLLYTVCNSCNRRFNVSVAQLLTRTRDFEAHQRKKGRISKYLQHSAFTKHPFSIYEHHDNFLSALL